MAAVFGKKEGRALQASGPGEIPKAGEQGKRRLEGISAAVKKVLLVDDEPRFSAPVTGILASKSLAVEKATNRESALAIAGKEARKGAPFDLILIKKNLGKRPAAGQEPESIRLARELREADPVASLVLMTFGEIPKKEALGGAAGLFDLVCEKNDVTMKTKEILQKAEEGRKSRIG